MLVYMSPFRKGEPCMRPVNSEDLYLSLIHIYLCAAGNKFLNRFRDCGNAPFSVHDFFGDTES